MWSNSVNLDFKAKFKVGSQVLLSISKIALHHPSLRRKFAARWVGPCRVTELIGRTAARIQLPSTLQKLRLHDVFHLSALTPDESVDHNESTAETEERQASDLTDFF